MTIKEQLLSLFDHEPTVDLQTAMDVTGCSRRYYYRVKKWWRAEHADWRPGHQTDPCARTDDSSAPTDADAGEEENDTDVSISDFDGMGFKEFVRDHAFPRWHHDEPNELYDFQFDLFVLCMLNDFSMINVPRDHGKSVFLGYFIQYAMVVLGKNILFLGWTDRRKEIALQVYFFFYHNELLASRPNVRNSPYSFAVENESTFETYSMTSKDILGKHNIWLVVDDPIDDSFKDEAWKEAKLERRWKSTIANLNADKTIICGTRKCEDDFFDFIERKYADLGLSVYRREPYLKPGQRGYATHKDHLLCPERWTVRELELKKREVGEYWWSAEYCQNPHPAEGGTFENFEFIERPASNYAMLGIAVDSAWSVNETSDNTAIILGGLRSDGKLDIIRTSIGKMKFNQIMSKIDEFYLYARSRYKGTAVQIFIETNGGSEWIIQQAQTDIKYRWGHQCVGIHHKKDKIVRITSSLENPVNNGAVRFNIDLSDGELVSMLESFPRCPKFDAPDACAMLVFQLFNKRRGSVHQESMLAALEEVGI